MTDVTIHFADVKTPLLGLNALMKLCPLYNLGTLVDKTISLSDNHHSRIVVCNIREKRRPPVYRNVNRYIGNHTYHHHITPSGMENPEKPQPIDRSKTKPMKKTLFPRDVRIWDDYIQGHTAKPRKPLSRMSDHKTNSQNMPTPKISRETVEVKAVQEEPILVGNIPKINHNNKELTKQLEDVFRHFPSVLDSERVTETRHNTEHHIEITDIPKKPKIYPIPFIKREQTRAKITEWVDKGILESTSSHIVSPLAVPTKSDGSVRPCGDFQALNKVTRPDVYPMPRLDHIVQTVKGNIFSSLDLKDGYFQVPIKEEDRHKTAIITPWGTFQFKRMPFGLRNAASTFQRLMDEILKDLDFVACYIDDIIIFSNSVDEHVDHLRQVLERLDKNGLRLNTAKCTIAVPIIEFLGFEFSEGSYRPASKVNLKIDKLQTPVSRKGVQSLLGVLNYYRNHVPNYAQTAAPLTQLLQQTTRFKWTAEAAEALAKLTDTLRSRLALAQIEPGQPFVLHTDASSEAIGGVLFQDNKVVGLFSRKLTATEKNYSTMDREALAIKEALKKFRVSVIGYQVEVHTDHKPLVNWNERQAISVRHTKWLASLADYTFTIHYLPGNQNVVADMLSRPKILKTDEKDADGNRVAAIQIAPMIQEFAGQQTIELVNQCRLNGNEAVLENGLWVVKDKEKTRVIVPHQFVHEILKLAHTFHPGIEKMYEQVKEKFIWPGIYKDIREFVRQCPDCQKQKVSPVRPRENAMNLNVQPLQCVHIDLVGPLPTSGSGCSYLLTMIDRASGWLVAKAIRQMTANTVAQVFFDEWVCAFGIPKLLISDQGAQFESEVFRKLLASLGIERRRTTAYHPQTNGKVERAHRTLKNALRCMTAVEQDWEKALPKALFLMRTSIQKDGLSPAQRLYGQRIDIPIDTFNLFPNRSPEVNPLSTLRNLLTTPRQTRKNRPVSSYVWLRVPGSCPSLSAKYTGPYKVISSNYPTFNIEIGGVQKIVNVDRTKPAFLPRDATLELDTDADEGYPEQARVPEAQTELTTIKTQASTAHTEIPPDDRLPLPEASRSLSKGSTEPGQPYVTRYGREIRPVERCITNLPSTPEKKKVRESIKLPRIGKKD